jgi:hypothetical protein
MLCTKDINPFEEHIKHIWNIHGQLSWNIVYLEKWDKGIRMMVNKKIKGDI